MNPTSRLMIGQLFTQRHIHKIIVDVDPANSVAIKTYEKVGLRMVRSIQMPEGLVDIMELTKPKDS